MATIYKYRYRSAGTWSSLIDFGQLIEDATTNPLLLGAIPSSADRFAKYVSGATPNGLGITIDSEGGTPLIFADFQVPATATANISSGVWRFGLDAFGRMPGINPSDVTGSFAGLTISQGEVFLITADGTLFSQEVKSGYAIVSKIDNPSILPASTDWQFLAKDALGEALTPDQMALLATANRSGTQFTFNKHVFVDQVNISGESNPALPALSPGSWIARAQESTEEIVPLSLGNDSVFMFQALTGGKLTLGVTFSEISVRGFIPELVRMEFTYGTGGDTRVFSFPLTGIQADNGMGAISIDIPAVDYSGIIGDSPIIHLIVNERGSFFQGNVSLLYLVNTVKGTLHDSVVNLARNEVVNSEAQLSARIDALDGREQDYQQGTANTFASIEPRLSPTALESLVTPEGTDGYFKQDPGGNSSPPSDIATDMQQVTPGHSTFTASGASIFVAVPPSVNIPVHSLQNNTTPGSVALTTANASADPFLDIIGSQTVGNKSFSLFRYSGLTTDDVVEIVHLSIQKVEVWPRDIAHNKADIAALQQSQSLPLPHDVQNILLNDVTVTKEASVPRQATQYNKDLGSGSDTKVEDESPATAAPSGGFTTSNAISTSPANTRGRKLITFREQAISVSNTVVLSALSGVETPRLIMAPGGVVHALQKVPAQPGGTQTVNVSPLPATQVDKPWFTIDTLVIRNGVPILEADELFFTRNIPHTSVTLDINYRGHANGNVFGTGSTTLAGVGGGADVSTTFTISDGGESATIQVLWRHQQQDIRVSVTEHLNTGLPTINDVQVHLDYDIQRDVPAQPETSRTVAVADFGIGGSNRAIFFMPSETRVSSDGNNDPTLIIVGNTIALDTGYGYDELFGNDDAGGLRARGDDVGIYNVKDTADIGVSRIVEIESRLALPNDGFFTNNHTHASVVHLDTQLEAENHLGDAVKVGRLNDYTIEYGGKTYQISGFDLVSGQPTFSQV